MPTAIAVTSPDLVLPPTDRQTPTAVVLRPPESQSLGDALSETQLLLEHHGYLVVLYPATLPAAHERRLHTVRSLLESGRIALLRSELPPLALGVLVRQLRQLSVCDFSPGVVASAARLLSHYLYAGAVLGSVAKLDRVPVSLKSHAKSWMPGSQFAVLAAPRPALVRLGSGRDGRAAKDPKGPPGPRPPGSSEAGPGAAPAAAGSGGREAELLAGPEFATELLVARGQLASDWPQDVLAPAWQVGAVRECPLPDGSPEWWGTPRAVEFAAYLPDITVLYQLVSSVRREVCSWCGTELIGDRCCFCSAAITPQEVTRRVAGALTRGNPS
ncbi:hypothetical protein [Streptomyces fuscigenes]|uniref:hypothetical protein n=1 Tax=Streptomyces fuscigenes TaxID=1528880 RepID=UPI001F2913A0|nr:hypothetical protein [Streptomyces fuscigenes]MCF3963584.1 hypothetical protein [Streptomyces fuscigenes]